MLLHKTFQYKLRPDQAQLEDMARAAGSCRWLWNEAISLQSARRDADLPALNYPALCRWLTLQRKLIPWLEYSPASAQQQTLKNYDQARQEAFDPELNRGHPKRKIKGKCTQSFEFAQDFELVKRNGHMMVKLPKIGWMRLHFSRPLEGELKHIVITKEADGWYISCQTERLIPDIIHDHVDAAVGVDLGVVRFATLSDGTIIEGPNALKKSEEQLRRAQKDLSRKVLGSSNYKKQKQKVALLHQYVARIREDFLHKTSTHIAKNHGVVVMEDLCLKSMTRSARGTMDCPGKNVRRKAALNLSVLDQGFGYFKKMLAYKLEKRGGVLFLVGPAFTSQTCSMCSHIDAASRVSQAVFCCTKCGFTANADDNASNTIMQKWAAGHAVKACGGNPELAGPVKQEPGQNLLNPDAVGITRLKAA